MKQQKLTSAAEAISHIQDGDTIMIGGFGLRGTPSELIEALARSGKRDLTIISNSGDSPGIGIGALLRNGQIKRLIGTHYNMNREVAEARNAGQIEVTLVPMGNLVEAIRAGGFGIPAFYVPVAVGTQLGEGKEVREFDGRRYLLERALKADVALIRARKADTMGNLVYHKTARNFNPVMATAAKYTVAVADEIVEPGQLPPDSIITAHIYVDALVRAEDCHD